MLDLFLKYIFQRDNFLNMNHQSFSESDLNESKYLEKLQKMLLSFEAMINKLMQQEINWKTEKKEAYNRILHFIVANDSYSAMEEIKQLMIQEELISKQCQLFFKKGQEIFVPR